MDFLYRRLSLSLFYDTVFFPFDTVHFIKKLSSEGFLLPEKLENISPLGARVEITGIVGRKGDIAIKMDSDRRSVSIEAPSINLVISEAGHIERILQEEFDLKAEIGPPKYFEALASVSVSSKKSPLKQWAQLFASMPIVKAASDVLGTNVCVFGARFVPRGALPHEYNWFDLQIAPLIQLANKRHWIDLVYRNVERQKVIEFLDSLESVLASLLQQVEQ